MEITKALCEHFHCSDSEDKQFPECNLYGGNKCSAYPIKLIHLECVESLQSELEAVKAENKILEENCVLSYKELRELLERR